MARLRPCTLCGKPCRPLNKQGWCLNCRRRELRETREIRSPYARMQYMDKEFLKRREAQVKKYQQRASESKGLFDPETPSPGDAGK